MNTNINMLAELIRKDDKVVGWKPVVIHDWAMSDYKVPTFLALLHSEICEAFAHTASDSPDAFFAAELADIQIRTLDLAGGLTADFAHYVEAGRNVDIILTTDDACLFNLLHSYVTAALEAFRRDRQVQCLSELGQLYAVVEYVAAQYYQIDLPLAIDKKMRTNRMRTTRHGGKRV